MSPVEEGTSTRLELVLQITGVLAILVAITFLALR